MDKIGKTDAGLKRTFRMVPDTLWLDDRLDHVDVRVWCCLAFVARGRDECDATDAALAEMIGTSDRTIRRALDRLQDAGYLTRRRVGAGRSITLKPDGDSDGERRPFTLKLVG